jgi:cytochrome P450
LAGFDPLSHGFLDSPDAILRRARADCPAFYIPELDIWAITRYEDVAAAYSDFRTFSSELTNAPAIPERYADRVPRNFFPPTNICMDPPGHTAMRKAANQVFTRPRVAAMHGHVRRIVDDLIDHFAADTGCDIVQQFSYPLSARSSMHLIGIPEDDLPRFEQLAENLVAVLPYRPGADTNTMSEADWLLRWERVVEARDYFGEFVSEREQHPTDDLASTFIAARHSDGTPVLSHDEVVTYMLLFIFAGTDTVASFLGLLLMQLAANPAQQAELRRDPSLWPNAVEEGLRRRSSNLGNQRRTTRAVEIDGVTIPQDATVWLITASASNDEHHFAAPERFDIHRDNAGDHLAFGRGRHFCMGAPLARLEVPIAIQRLWERLPGFRVVPDQRLTYDPVFVTLLYNHLQVEWGA